jgi:hypothetical protein
VEEFPQLNNATRSFIFSKDGVKSEVKEMGRQTLSQTAETLSWVKGRSKGNYVIAGRGLPSGPEPEP